MVTMSGWMQWWPYKNSYSGHPIMMATILPGRISNSELLYLQKDGHETIRMFDLQLGRGLETAIPYIKWVHKEGKLRNV